MNDLPLSGQDRPLQQAGFVLVRRSRTALKTATGNLIAPIQKKWNIEAGEPGVVAGDNVMHAAHDLLMAASKFGSIASAIGSGSVSSFLGARGLRLICESYHTLLPSKALMINGGRRPKADNHQRAPHARINCIRTDCGKSLAAAQSPLLIAPGG